MFSEDLKEFNSRNTCNNVNINVHEKLNLHAKEDKITKLKLEEEKKMMELKECTFIPKINKIDTFGKKRKSISANNFRNT
jgi:hypothetical protein